ncbi:MAG: DIP1984 family protein [Ruminococcus sp.]|nr:DIP1984 family protein [Ruminococcus sp.]
MKLATALSIRADLQGRLNELEKRLIANSKVQEGEKPSENPVELIAEKDKIIAELENLISKINITNSVIKYNDVTVTEMLAKRDCLKINIRIMRNFLNSSSDKVNRYSKSEIAIKSTVDVAAYQKKVDLLCKELREIDEKIQEINWTNELI